MQLIYVALLFLGGALSVFLPARLYFRHGASVIALSPFFWFSIYYFIIHFIVPFYKHHFSIYRYQDGYDELVLIYNAAISLLAYIFAYLLIRRTKIKNLIRGASFLPSNGAREAVLIGILLYLVGAVFSWQTRSEITGSIGLADFMSDRIAHGSSLGLGQHFSNLLIIGSVLFFAGWLKLGRHWLWFGIVISSAMFFFSFTYFSLLSSRNSILIIGVFHLVVLCAVRPFKAMGGIKRVRSALLLMLPLIIFIGVGYQTTVARFENREGAYAEQQLQNVWYAMFDGSFGNDENLLWLIENDHQYYFGLTYLAGLTNLVPRAIWDEKPWGAGPEIRNMIYPGSYTRDGQFNSSITTGLLTEARMNFGVLGIFIAVLLWSRLTGYVMQRASHVNHIVPSVLLLLSATALSTMLMYSEFLGFFSRYVLLVVPPLILHRLFRFRTSYTTRLRKV
jgi:oligosaccharide repeat unit polymerase